MAYTTIDKPTDYFNTKLYTGNGSSGHAITGVGFQPDWIWWKHRGSVTYWHNLMDSVRGASKQLYSNESNLEGTNTNGLESFDSDGFTVGSDNGANESGQNFVAWNWLASNTTASNTDGTITSTVSANTTAGFSIVSYTGTGSNATVGHGLSVAPSMVIIKNRDDGQSWRVGVTSIGFDKYLGLNGTGASTSSSGMFNNTAPTTSVFSVGSDGSTNASGEKCIAYCFADVKGYSKFGSYTGNGNADGTFVYLGFKPAWVMIKASSQTADWVMFDNKRNPFNLVEKYLDANTSDAEGDDSGGSGSWELDFVSNGFKLRENSGGLNQNGTTFIYMAFAENPFVSSGGIPCTAR